MACLSQQRSRLERSGIIAQRIDQCLGKLTVEKTFFEEFWAIILGLHNGSWAELRLSILN